MKSSGDYALLHANGTPFAEVVRLIREEVLQELGLDPDDIEHPTCRECGMCVAKECGDCVCYEEGPDGQS